MIRPARIDDIDAIVALGRSMHAESAYRVLSFSEEKVRQLVPFLIDNGDFAWVAEKNGEVIGMYGARVVEHWCSTDLIAGELVLFVSPDRRGGMAAYRLIRRYAEWARDKGAKIIRAGVNTGVKVEETQKIYEAAGFRYAGPTLELTEA